MWPWRGHESRWFWLGMRIYCRWVKVIAALYMRPKHFHCPVSNWKMILKNWAAINNSQQWWILWMDWLIAANYAEYFDFCGKCGQYSPQNMRGMRKYIHSLDRWLQFKWDINSMKILLTEARFKQGVLSGKGHTIGFDLQMQAYLESLSLEEWQQCFHESCFRTNV